MMKRDQTGSSWIVDEFIIKKDKTPMKGRAKIFVDDIYCGEYKD